MGAFISRMTTPLRRLAAGLFLAAAVAIPLLPAPAAARGPEGIADVAEQVIDSVVNISTKQTVDMSRNEMPQLPPGSPFEQFFDEFFKNRSKNGETPEPRRINSLGSGFIIDPAGYVVTNNHVIAGADEIDVILDDGTKMRATVVGRDTKTDLALLKVTPTKPLKAVKFGDSDKLRLGEWVIAIGNPFSLGGTVTAGIVSARNRDIRSGPYDNYIQTDAAINRGNSGGPLFNLNGEVVGVNTAIISPSGGSIGIGFAVPSKTVVPVIQQLREYKEVRRGWLGVRIQEVTDEIADSLNVKPPRGALVAGVDGKGPAKPAGIEPGDVIVTFDGQEVKGVHDLPRIVADTPVGKDVAVTVIRKGKEVTKHVKVGLLKETDEKEASLAPTPEIPPEAKPAVKKALGLGLADLSQALRKQHKIKDGVKGVLITAVDPASKAAEKHLVPGMVIAEVQQNPVNSTAELQSRLDRLKKDGKKTVVLLVLTPDGDPSFVALALQ
jgi:serine protease Do